LQPKYTRMSRIHQALCKIEHKAMDIGALRLASHFKYSTKIFDQSVIQPLVNDGMILRRELYYYITPKGSEKLDELGRYTQTLNKTRREPRQFLPYDGNELICASVRPGADDHFAFPSRRGNTLFYKDGKEVAI
jgi:predicted transcriptional regulator